MTFEADAILSSGFKEVKESWQADHQKAMECRDLESKLRSGLFLYNFYRLLDENWSRKVQSAEEPFNPDVARAIHSLYSSWFEPVPSVQEWLARVEETFDVEGADAFRKAVRHMKRLVAVDVESLILSRGQYERGETVLVGDDYEPASSVH